MRVRRLTTVVLAAAVVVAVIVFVAAHPGRFPWAFRYGQDWRGALVARTADADGLRIHAAHEDRKWVFQPHDGETYFETHDADVARAFLDLVRIDDRASGDHCLCVGGNEIDVLRGNSVATSFLIKHGHTLRSMLLWPGDARLTDDSAEAVCAWLVAHGVDEESPRKRTARIAAETKARDAAQDALLGRERAEALRACQDEASVGALFAKWEPDAVDRIVLAVRFLALEPSGEPSGADDAGARAYNYVEGRLWHADDFAAYVAAFDRLLADDSVAAAAAYQFSLIDGWHGDELPKQGLPELRMKAARRLLASSSDYRRACGVELLDRVGDTPEVRAILLGLLPPAADGDRPAEPTTDAQMQAVSRVVRFCDPSMFPRLQAMADAASDRDRWSKRIAHRIAARRDPADADPLDETMDVLPRSPMDGVVRAADGTAVAGASVRLTDPRRAPIVGEFFTWTIRADTDERGRFHLDVPVAQRWHVSVVHDDHPYLLRRDVDLRDPPKTMDLALPKERTIRGRVVDAAGRPRTGVVVAANRRSPFDTHANESLATTDADGTFEFKGFDAEAAEVLLHLHVEPARWDTGADYVVRPGDPPVELRDRD